jgi:hypothetical protein
MIRAGLPGKTVQSCGAGQFAGGQERHSPREMSNWTYSGQLTWELDRFAGNLHSCAGLLERGDERAPGAGGHAQHVAVPVFGVSYQHGADRGGDFYALAAVGA